MRRGPDQQEGLKADSPGPETYDEQLDRTGHEDGWCPVPQSGGRGTLGWATLQSKGPWSSENLIATCPLSGASRIGLDRGTPSTACYLEEGLGQGGDMRGTL